MKQKQAMRLCIVGGDEQRQTSLDLRQTERYDSRGADDSSTRTYNLPL